MILAELQNKSQQIRLAIVNLAEEKTDGHVASAMSAVELMAYLYYQEMNKEDQFILSKGHGCLALFAILKDKGFNPEYCGHPDINTEQGIESTTGSLGHGISIAAGKALAKKLKNEAGRIFVVIGDGESQEGTVWETVNIVNRYKLNNLIIIVDHNKLQALDTVENIMFEKNLKAKFEAFGMHVLEIDGHDYTEISRAFSSFKSDSPPTLIIAHTIKGKGISFMEADPKWQSRMMNREELEIAKKEISAVGE